MTNEHNPIAQLISRIQQKWADEIAPFADIRLVRWLIDPEESQLYEGFLKIESSQHGKLPDIFVVLLVSFESIDTYSRELAKCWFEAMEKDIKVFEQLAANGKGFNWDSGYFKRRISEESGKADGLLLEMLRSFQTALSMPGRPLTLVLFPYNISSVKEYEDWLKRMVKITIPEQVRFCIFDLKEQRFYDGLFDACDPQYAKTIQADIDLAGAIKKVINAGNPNDPGVRLQQYIQQMSEAAAAGKLAELEQKGKACIDDMKSSKIRSLLATACIAYAGILFHFRKYELIEELLNEGLRVAELGQRAEDPACIPLIQQFYSFKGANYQLNKKNNAAITCFLKSAELALQNTQVLPAITSFRQAAFLAKKHQPEMYPSILKKGFDAGENVEAEQLMFSEYGFLSFEYYTYLHFEGHDHQKEEVDEKMKAILGENWKSRVEEQLVLQNQKTAA